MAVITVATVAKVDYFDEWLVVFFVVEASDFGLTASGICRYD